MRPLCLLIPCILISLLACGGSSHGDSNPGATPSPMQSPTPVVTPQPGAASIQYLDPSGSGWRFVKNVGDSTPTSLALDLVGPSGTLARGLGLTLLAEPSTFEFLPYPDGAYFKDYGVFDLGLAPGSLGSAAVPFAVSGIKGNVLMMGLFQKDPLHTAKDCGRPLVQFRIRLKSGVQPGWPAFLEITKAQCLPAELTGIQALSNLEVSMGKISVN
jgi:hypothetical protein